jgi:cation diffusion facilitator CzcD-associated flavoprotein CzcO
MDKVECVVIGAGVIGLAVARRLAQLSRAVLGPEAAEEIGTVAVSRTSEGDREGTSYNEGVLVPCMNIAPTTAFRIAIAAS